MEACTPPRRIMGVDFSGARDAARRIWVCHAHPDGDALSVEDCHPLADRTPVKSGPAAACEALVHTVRDAAGPLAVGFDFPFGLKRLLLPPEVRDWRDFVAWFARTFDSPEGFRRWCRNRAQARHMTEGALKRDADQEVGTPWVPHNLRLHKQTYFGIRHVLEPLVTVNGCVGIPYQPLSDGDRWLLETCPASALKRAGLSAPYKGRGPAHRAWRETLLAHLAAQGVSIPAGALRERVLSCAGGDALDAILCAWVVWRAVRTPATLLDGVTDAHRIEGHVYC